MSIRHIYARPNEYIAVHRGRTKRFPVIRLHGNALLYVIGSILFLVFWKLLLTLTVVGFAFYFIVKCLWIYRNQIGNLLRMLAGKLRTLFSSCRFRIGRWLA